MKGLFGSLAQAFTPVRVPSRRDERTIIFLHIPKTAGTAIRDIVKGNYRKREIHNFPDIDAREAMEEFRRLPEEDRRRFRAVLGHMWFGLHEAIPRPAAYVTLLRDPVDRIVSHYHFVKGTPGHYLHWAVVDGGMTLGQYISSGLSTEFDNGQTRLVGGAVDEEQYPFGGCTEELFEKAVENLRRHFAVVGLQERFADTRTLFERLLGWRTRPVRRNVTPRRPPTDALPRRDREIIESHNRLDRRLYQIAGEIFEEQLAGGERA